MKDKLIMGYRYQADAADDGAEAGGGDTSDSKGGDDSVKKAIERERQRAKDAIKALQELKSQYSEIDLEEYKALKETAGKQKKAEADTIAKQNKQLEILTQEANTYKQRYEQMIVDSQISSAFNELGGKASSPGSIGYSKIVEKIVKDQVRYETDDKGNGHLIVVDENGDERIDEKGKVVTLKSLMAKLKEDDALSYCFNPDNPNAATGGFRSPANRTTADKGGKSNAQLQREIINDSSLSPEQKIAKAQQYGLM